jgi:alpha-glucosidase (family GH31 glycosyl hydrolase)
MPQLEIIPQRWSNIPTENKHSLLLKSLDTRHAACHFTFEIISASLFRITFTSSQHALPPHPSCPIPKPQLQDVEIAVLDSPESSNKVFTIGNSLVISVCWKITPEISISRKSTSTKAETLLYSDLQFRSYALDGPGVAHYTTYDSKKHHAGLGEKAAPFDLSGRTFRVAATDSFGYDGYKTDPLYKHIPLLISAGPQGCVAQFSSSHSRGMISVGGEMDGLWGKYKVYRQDYGGLEEYLMVGDTLRDITQTYANLVGKPRLVPRWALGYIAGGMKYSMLDDPPAEEALMKFAERMRIEDIPCSAFQLSSGYTVAETEPKTRNVFTWNNHRFPDPQRFLKTFSKMGIRIIANVKPYVLKNHPGYASLESQGALFRNPASKETAIARLWSAGGGESGEGSHLDFTSQAAYQWWYRGVRQLLKEGVAGVWNDNNEYTIPYDDWECKLDGKELHTIHLGDKMKLDHSVGRWGRALHTELMAKSSFDAYVDECPKIRPYVLTRSATAGTMRYAASSWSGDNVTSWASMKAGNAMSLNAGLSLLTVS